VFRLSPTTDIVQPITLNGKPKS